MSSLALLCWNSNVDSAEDQTSTGLTTRVNTSNARTIVLQLRPLIALWYYFFGYLTSRLHWLYKTQPDSYNENLLNGSIYFL